MMSAFGDAVRALVSKKNSPSVSSFNPIDLLPDRHTMTPLDPADAPSPFGAPLGNSMPAHGSVSPPSVFDFREENNEHAFTEPTAPGYGSDEPNSYDLKPPPPSVSRTNVEALAERFFSADHLDLILRDPALASKFTHFVNQYRPETAPTLARYLETKKAIAALEYANAIADHTPPSPGHPPYIAATLDDRFEARNKRTVEQLLQEALPGYVTNRLVHLVTESLVKEITGNNAPIMREMIPSLAEVYCVTDPSLPDNPIVYASEEFYNTSQYGREYVIGRNCRFLQGPKTSTATVRRLIDALAAGVEICETILNYRRDGSPFMNLLLIAPLYDNKGHVRYFLGCQIDVSPLVEGGRGLESFEQLLAKDRTDSRFGGRQDKDPKIVLGELGAMLSEEESTYMKDRTRRFPEGSGKTTPMKAKGGRRIIGMEDSGASARALWPHPSLGPSGRLPGVYQSYLLVRPYPSLRITFTSPALRIPGLLQTKLLERVGGAQHVRDAILDSLAHGTAVTAKISWLTNSNQLSDRQSALLEGKPRWIHCTPLLGSDEKVGVWMVVMVEDEEVTGSLNAHARNVNERNVNERNVNELASPQHLAAPNNRYTGSKLYAEHMRREGRAGTTDGSVHSRASHESERERRLAEDSFRDF